MIPCTLQEICAAVGGVLLYPGEETVTGVTTNSREAAGGDLFIPLVGERFDGHDFIPMALQNGAGGCLTMREPPEPVPGKYCVQVDDTLLALKRLAGWYRDRFDLPTVQITGSAGKTTTKEMIAAVLSRRFRTLKNRGNLNNAIGTPLTLLELAPEHEAAVVETGTNHFGEIRYLGEIVRPDIAVITNVGDAHIGNLGGSRQGVLQAKSEIFEFLEPGGLAVLNGDDPLLRGLSLPFDTVLCGRGENCRVRVSQVQDRGIDGLSCTVTTEKAVYPVSIPSPGEYMIYPAAMAVAVGEALGLTKEEICRGIAAYVPVGHRMNVVRLPGGRILIDDCYNANPQAMEEALKCLAKTPCRRRVAVLGSMGELGELAAAAHRSVGEMTVRFGVDEVVAVGELARGITETNGRARWFASIPQALETVHELFGEDTAMLVKASLSMQFSQITEDLLKQKYT